MTAQLIDGEATAAAVHGEIKAEAEKLKSEHGITPGLATVLVGEDPASQAYVRSKHRRCGEVGIESFGRTLPEDASQEEVEAVVAELNADPAVHGILVQLPLPKHLDEERVLRACGHDSVDPSDLPECDVLMKEIAHQGDGDPPRLAPPQRPLEHLRDEANTACPAGRGRVATELWSSRPRRVHQALIRAPWTSKPGRHPLRPAVPAPIRDPLAAAGRRPRLITPRNTILLVSHRPPRRRTARASRAQPLLYPAVPW